MKRIFSILFVLALVLGFNLVAATPAAAAVINVPGDQSTIQAAVTASGPGDEILVAAGTYVPFTVDGKSDLTIQANGAVIVQGAQSVATNYTDRDCVIFVKDSTDISLRGLDVQGSNLGDTNQKNYGIIYEDSSGEIYNCTVSPNTAGDMSSTAIGLWDSSDVDVECCTLENYGRIGILIYNGCTADIQGGSIEGQVYSDEDEVCYGVEVEGAFDDDDPLTASDVTIDCVEIYNCDNTYSPEPSWGSAGVYINGWMEYYDAADSTVEITNCNIHDNYDGIDAIKSPSSFAHNNNICNNRDEGVESAAAHDTTTASFDAENNWWCAADGPSGAGGGSGDAVSANVDYTPWLGAQANLPCPVVDVYVKDSNNNPIHNARVKYKLGWEAWMGYTDLTGHVTKVFPAGTTNLEVWVYYNHTVSPHQTQNISGSPNFTFQTVEVTLRLEKCIDSTPLDGGHGRYGSESSYGTWHWPGGNTGSGTNPTGETAAELFPGGTFSFEMGYQGTTTVKMNEVIPNNNTTLTWQTTNVAFNYSGPIAYGGPTGDSAHFIKPSMELLQGTYKFNFRGGGVRADVTISGCTMNKNVAVLNLKDHMGSPMAGGTGRGGYGASYGTWHVPGSTDADGKLIDIRDASGTTMSYEMKYNNTTKVETRDVALNSFFDYQTNELKLILATCGKTLLDGGNPRYGIGSTYTTWWFPGGPTGSSGPGQTVAEFFPGTYSFEMQYKGTAATKMNVVIPDAYHTLVWETTKVTLNYSGPIAYGGPTGDSAHFTKPSMELLPGTYKFHFRYVGRADLTFSGCSYTCTASTTPDLHPVQYRFGAPAPGYSFAAWPPIFESWTDVRIQNDSAQNASNVKAWISDAPPHVTIVDGAVSIASIPSGGGSAWSSDTYTLKVDMSMGVDPSLGVTWTIEADDAGGIHYIFFNVPQ